MVNEENEEDEKVKTNIIKVKNQDLLPTNHFIFLYKLKSEMNFTPKVAWDVGSAVYHWTKKCEELLTKNVKNY